MGFMCSSAVCFNVEQRATTIKENNNHAPY